MSMIFRYSKFVECKTEVFSQVSLSYNRKSLGSFYFFERKAFRHYYLIHQAPGQSRTVCIVCQRKKVFAIVKLSTYFDSLKYRIIIPIWIPFANFMTKKDESQWYENVMKILITYR
jgi:hypothetical protein